MRINTIVGSLIGAFAIYGVMAACSSGAGLGLLGDAGPDGDGKNDGPVARAEAAPADCSQWEIQVIEVPALTPYNTGAWEPISATLQNSATGATEIAIRRCVP